MVANPSSCRVRSAYTLLEVTLVVALIAIVAGIAVPSFGTMYARQRLDGPIDSVRASWATAKAQAIAEGRPYRFSVVLGKGNFRVAPDRGPYWEDSSYSGEGDPEGPGMIRAGGLPGGVCFSNPGDLSVTAGETNLPLEQITAQQWAPVVVFQPDGTTTEDVEIVFHLGGTRARVVRLRGMTGAVSVHSLGGI